MSRPIATSATTCSGGTSACISAGRRVVDAVTLPARSIAELGPEFTLRTIGIRCSTLRNCASARCPHGSPPTPNHVSFVRLTNSEMPPGCAATSRAKLAATSS